MMPRLRFDTLWRILWQVATSDYLLGIVLLTLALAILLAAWLPQTSTSGTALGVNDLDWQAEVQRRFGGDGWFDTIRSPLQAVGVFQIADAAWFRLLLALLAFALLARLAESVEGLWQGWRGSAPPDGPLWVAVEGTFDEALTALRRRRLRIVVVDREETGDEQTEKVPAGSAPAATADQSLSGDTVTPRLVRADRWPWGELGPILVYLGGLVVMLGAAVTTLWGWQTGPLPVTAGESVPLGQESDLQLRMQELAQDGQRGVGEIRDAAERLVSVSDLAVGRPLTGGGIGVYLVSSGPALRVQATLSDTQILPLATGRDSEPREELVFPFTDDAPRYAVGVPEVDLVLFLTLPRSEQAGAAPRVQLFESGSGQLIQEQDVPDDTIITVGDVSFILAPVPYAEMRVVRDPGAFWSQLGFVLLIAGVVLWGVLPSRRVWLRRRTASEESPDTVESIGDVDLLSKLGAGDGEV
jgi:cytochrome c biogenesis protein ResB